MWTVYATIKYIPQLSVFLVGSYQKFKIMFENVISFIRKIQNDSFGKQFLIIFSASYILKFKYYL